MATGTPVETHPELNAGSGLPLSAPLAPTQPVTGNGTLTSSVGLRNLRLMRVLERIAARFNEAEVPLMALKGAALNLTLYDCLDRRPMADLDLMVHPEDVDQAFALLEELGGLRGEPLVREDFFPRFHYEMEYSLGRIYPVKVDLHVRPFRPLRYSRLIPAQAFWDAAEPVSIGRGTVLLPSVEDTLIHLSVHAAVHGCSRDKWVEDIKLWVEAYGSRIDWECFLDRVKRWRLVLPVREALQHTSSRLGAFCPTEIMDRLAQMRVGWRDRLALRQAPRDATHPSFHVAVNVLCTPGWRFVLGYLRAVILPGKAHMEDWYGRRHWGWLPCAHLLRWLGPLMPRPTRGRSLFSKVEVRPSAIHGVGVFTTRDVAAGEVVARFSGKRVDRGGIYVAWRRNESGVKERYEITGKLRYLNHSCHPNARLSRFALVAQRPVLANEELTIEYEGATCTCQERHHGWTADGIPNPPQPREEATFQVPELGGRAEVEDRRVHEAERSVRNE